MQHPPPAVRRPAWLWPALAALILFVGGVAGNLIATYVQDDLTRYEPWVWTAFGVALIVTIITAVRDARRPAAQPEPPAVAPTVIHDHTAINATVRESANVAIGQQITQIVHYYQAAHPVSDAAALATQVRQYLTWVQDQYGWVILRGVRSEGGQVMRLRLDTVYVPLAAEARRRFPGEALGSDRQRRTAASEATDEPQTLELNQLLPRGERLVVTGGPGSGKTTVLQHIAWTLAAAALNDDKRLVVTKLGLAQDVGALLPIFVPLSAYAQHRRRMAAEREPATRTLAAFISHYLIEQQCVFGLPADFFADLIQRGQGVILLLDGLDEVPDEAERAHVRQAIEQLVSGRRDQVRIVVTCRVAAYKDKTALAQDFQEVRVQPLDEAHIRALVERAYAAVYQSNPTRRATRIAELLDGITDLEGERQRRLGDDAPRLIDSPLMVRLLLIVHLSERRFPQHRAELYWRATDNLLWPEYLLDEEAAARIGQLVGQNHETHRDLVQLIAWQLHNRGEQQGREIDEDALRTLLAAAHQPPALVDDLCKLTRLRGTLLEERLGVYRFIHLAFQEFLAARYLAEEVRDIGSIVRHFAGGPLTQSWWREPALLVAGYLSLNARGSAQRYVRGLADQQDNRTPDGRLAAAELAAVACLEWLADDDTLCTEISGRLVTLLDDTTLMNAATPSVRAAAGVALGRLGDLRPGVGIKNGLPDIAWSALIEPGPFRMGSDKRKDALAFDDEQPQFTCNLIKESYRISRYPITVAQYHTFVEAGGYRQRHYWTEAGWVWREQNAISGPATYGGNFAIANHPQVKVSWYEAVAFCGWLKEEVGHPVRLPTEAEWERAARHTDGRIYPWGDKWDETRCNNAYLNLHSTTAVGSFPAGDAACGAADMSGNAWEWCSTKWLDNYQDYEERVDDGLAGNAARVVRGGSWNLVDRSVRSAGRDGYDPLARNFNLGFRFVVSPGF